ncbi:MAG: magnesium chelatase, partial [Ignavibacteriae bacterium]|nr:magnesium chelatase [Ignavibacteriota bacterium]
RKLLGTVTNLDAIIKQLHPQLPENEYYLMMEFLLHGLAEYSLISKQRVEFGMQFKDMISTMFSQQKDDDEDYNFNEEDFQN